MSAARPLRFLALALGLWIGGRALMFAMPAASPRPDQIARAAPGARPPGPAQAAVGAAPAAAVLSSEAPFRPFGSPASHRRRPTPSARSSILIPMIRLPAAPSRPAPAPPRADSPTRPVVPVLLAAAPVAARAGRWSGSAWLLFREDRGATSLAPGGTLGGSQAGARLLYRIGDRIALSGRIYLPQRRRSEAELAAGVDWRPFPRIPFRLLAERRQDLGGQGRSAFSLTAYGGLERRLPGPLRAEAHAQAGVVGLRSRDIFVDASLRVTVPIGPVELGGGAWGAAQPGAERLDAGPSLSWRLPVRGSALRLQADWRFRLAGDAAPGSGPALTLAADF